MSTELARRVGRAGAVLGILLTVLLTGIGSNADAQAAHRCTFWSAAAGDAVWHARVTKLSCKKARWVVRRAEGPKGQPAGWRCQGDAITHEFMYCGAPWGRRISARVEWRPPDCPPGTHPAGGISGGCYDDD